MPRGGVGHGVRAVRRRRRAASRSSELPLTIALRHGPARAPPLPDPLARRRRARDRGERDADRRRTEGTRGAMAIFWPVGDGGRGLMRVKVWGARGSVPSPGPETTRYGGNTSACRSRSPTARSWSSTPAPGIRSLGLALTDEPAPLNILLTHLHLDHIQGLMFFAPAFRPSTEMAIWGPERRRGVARRTGSRATSRRRCRRSRCASCPCHVSFRDAPTTEWQIGPATIRAASVTHRGPTLGYRITEGDTSLCYIPDHEPALGARLDELEPEWISGFELARGADAADPRLPVHGRGVPRARRLGPLPALRRARLRPPRGGRAADALPPRPDALRRLPRRLPRACDRAAGRELGGSPAQIELAVERREIELGRSSV